MEQHMFTLYQKMVNEIIKKIEGGQLEAGSKLPSEMQLGQQFNVSRITVRRALSELEEKGYILKRQGQGSFVQRRSDDNSEFEYVDNPSQEIRKSGYRVTIKLISFQLIVDGSEGDVRTVFGIDKNAYLYKISQLYLANDRPILFKDTYLPFNSFPMISVNEIQNKEIVIFLANKYNLNSKQLHHEINANVASEEMPHYQELQPNKREPYVDIFTRGIQNTETVYYSRSIALNDLPMFLVSHKGRPIMTKHIFY
ncbi:GntR family transcriptional regulator [Pediococcus ethanolidurans]|uniref:GntR family transcriptional regulator n=1 Tax=Pediococcus ethanolidurans TaxID=319653 RepID=A0A0R2K2F6_9LACO|nr:GntR family transcriptional regulator [Pediococcus ethanolidurans]KRN83579.1 GntR family transcriptional regulator [Pediococcus ethanolidurans]SER03825.1 GntR family transcriptional regulator [Pediococcus ethanolidurans]